MKFKEWLIEVARSIPADINPNKIRIINNGNSYYASFTYKENNYIVSLIMSEGYFHSLNVPNVYEINFKGPRGFELVGNAGSSAITIYKYLIVAIKKMVDMIESSGKELNGFIFSFADETMALIYRKFYNDYLLPMGFVKVDSITYLKKSYLKNLMQTMDSQSKMVLGKNIASQRKYDKEGLERIRKRKIQLRKQKQQQPTETPAGYPSGWGHI